MGFKDHGDRLLGVPKKLPHDGVVYEFPGTVSARTGLIFHRMTMQAERARDAIAKGEQVDLDADLFDDLDDGQYRDMRAEVLGDAQWDLIDAEVPEVVVDHMLKTLIAWHQFGEDVAVAVWEDVPGAPKAPADRKPKARKAAATKTQRAGSTGGTTRSRKASPGRASSASGT